MMQFNTNGMSAIQVIYCFNPSKKQTNKYQFSADRFIRKKRHFIQAKQLHHYYTTQEIARFNPALNKSHYLQSKGENYIHRLL